MIEEHHEILTNVLCMQIQGDFEPIQQDIVKEIVGLFPKAKASS